MPRAPPATRTALREQRRHVISRATFKSGAGRPGSVAVIKFCALEGQTLTSERRLRVLCRSQQSQAETLRAISDCRSRSIGRDRIVEWA